jgi:hypothetical protein
MKIILVHIQIQGRELIIGITWILRSESANPFSAADQSFGCVIGTEPLHCHAHPFVREWKNDDRNKIDHS